MSSPCLLRATPVSQPRLREVKISLKSSSKDTAGSSPGGNSSITVRSSPPTSLNTQGTVRSYALMKEVTTRATGVTGSGSRSRSTPPVHRAHHHQGRRGVRTSGVGGGYPKAEPEYLPERNGTTMLSVPASNGAPVGLVLSPISSSSSTSSSSFTPRARHHPSPSRGARYTSSPSSSSSHSMRRGRWLSYSASNIYFNSVLDGRFRQLQGTELEGEKEGVGTGRPTLDELDSHGILRKRGISEGEKELWEAQGAVASLHHLCPK